MTQLVFTLNGATYSLTDEQVLVKIADVAPEAVRSHGVRLHGRVYPVKQVVALVTGIDRADFQSMQARSILRRLGFQVERTASESARAHCRRQSKEYGPKRAMF